ncbi:lipid droplet-associated protein [Amycolatopsis suaedae]|uniref:Lipid droplet-associated protein n=1 Tax=Amycolatopsis suaedae TaxID=2510978 RepID=A0A4Q7J7D0_9PSEU|nr:lipid droplet-associated protein [Amycolatopsis suaedae]RZQ63570.1 lipid droplet-associated protein [Amycolatopsis suaedae]
MKPLPLPLRIAAGLAVTTVERARELPRQLTGLPVTVASQVLQLSMRVQQHITELAIKGDDALAALRPVEEAPSWATFDEDLPAESTNGVADDPWSQEEQALAADHPEGEFDTAGPAGVAGYDDLTLPQLRARLRRFSAEQLEEILAYERDHANRPQFTGMLARRLGNLHRTGEASEENNGQ